LPPVPDYQLKEEKPVKKAKDKNVVKNVLCGGGSAVITCCFVHPFDLIKTRL